MDRSFSTPRVLALSLAAFAGLACACSADAQVGRRPNPGDNQALDANLERGSSGRNRSVRDVGEQIRYQNSIVTGTASGGRAFRGDIGYSDATDFRARLGSNDLYTFQRDTFLSGLVSMGVSARDTISVGSSLAIGQPSGLSPTGLGGTLALPRAGSSLQDARWASVRSTPSFLTGFGDVRQTTDSTFVAPGTPAAAGLGSGLLAPLEGQATPRAPGASDPTFGSPGAPGLRDPLAPTTADRALAWDRSNRLIASAGEAVRKSAITPTVDAAAAERASAQGGTPSVLDDIRSQLGQNAERSGVKAAPDLAGMGRPAWQAELERAMAAFDAEQEQKRKAQAAGEQEQPQDPADPSNQTPRTDPAQDPTKLDPTRLDPTKPAQRDPLEREFRSAITGEQIGRLALSPDFVRAMSRDLGKVDSLVRLPAVGERLPGVYEEHMAGAQAMLAAGRYFAAEERFARALSARAGDPMALVGRAHSQIGAGLYISAGLTLRGLFERHPELVGVRYAGQLLIPQERFEVVRTDMARALEQGGSLFGEAGLLLAYMGYQLQDAPSIRKGVDAMLQARPDDPITRLAVTVWSVAADDIDAKAP